MSTASSTATTATPVTGLLASLNLLQVTLEGVVAHIRLNRPAKRNALSDPLIQQLHTCFIRLPENIRCAVISGEEIGRAHV